MLRVTLNTLSRSTKQTKLQGIGRGTPESKVVVVTIAQRAVLNLTTLKHCSDLSFTLLRNSAPNEELARLELLNASCVSGEGRLTYGTNAYQASCSTHQRVIQMSTKNVNIKYSSSCSKSSLHASEIWNLNGCIWGKSRPRLNQHGT